MISVTKIKNWIKGVANFLHIYITKNQLYDRQTQLILKQIIKPDSNCIDVGCHKGEVLDLILQSAPNGQHFAFEPIPNLFENLSLRYKSDSRIQLYDIALSNKQGRVSFNYVVSNPAYSGLRKRAYDREGEIDKKIEVQTNLMDQILPNDFQVDFMKIDVEGAEFLVLQGAEETVSTYQPYIIFEFGMGAANHYNVSPQDIYHYFNNKKMSLNTLGGFLESESPFSVEDFSRQYTEEKNYYFIAYPDTSTLN